MEERLGRIRDQLKEWRQKFETRHGRPCSKSDISAIPAVASRFDQYKRLKAEVDAARLKIAHCVKAPRASGAPRPLLVNTMAPEKLAPVQINAPAPAPPPPQRSVLLNNTCGRVPGTSAPPKLSIGGRTGNGIRLKARGSTTAAASNRVAASLDRHLHKEHERVEAKQQQEQAEKDAELAKKMPPAETEYEVQVNVNVARNRDMLVMLGLCEPDAVEMAPKPEPKQLDEEPAPEISEPSPKGKLAVSQIGPQYRAKIAPVAAAEDFKPKQREAYAGRRENFVRQNLSTKNGKKINGLRKASGQGRAKRTTRKARSWKARQEGAEGESWTMASDMELIAVASGKNAVADDDWDKACMSMPLPTPGSVLGLSSSQYHCTVAQAVLDNPSEDRLLEELSRHFGHTEFREGQLFAIQRTLASESSLIVLPTGIGKSLCYQMPAIFLPGLTLVVSPLISLMIDQLSKLPLSAPGCLLTSQLTADQSAEVFRKVRERECKVLFVSPERFLSYSFMSLMDVTEVSAAVIDEVHCMSQWSHNFRPAYLKLGHMLRERLGIKCVLALTATATVATMNNIVEVLQIPTEGLHVQAPIRHNLHLSVSREEASENKLNDLVSLIKSPVCRAMRSIIVYVAFKWQATEVIQCLQIPPTTLATTLCAKQIIAAPYHAGMAASQRTSIYERFLKNKLRVVVATVAFGMGIDKSDVDGIIHYSMPKSVEAYVQEVGRAGRDMNTRAFCHTFLADDDWLRFRALLHSDAVDRTTICAIVQALLCTKDVAAPTKRKRGQPKIPLLRHHMAIEHLLKETKSLTQGTKCVVNLTTIECELDVRKELVETVLCYLAKLGHLRTLPPVCNSCELWFNRADPSDLKDPVVQFVLDEAARSAGKKFSFKMAAAANRLRMPVKAVEQHLFTLKCAHELRYELSDSGPHFELLQLPYGQDMPALVDHLYKIMSELVTSNLTKLDAAYIVLRQAVCCDGHGKAPSFLQDAHAESAALHKAVCKYFERASSGGKAAEMPDMEWVEQQMAAKSRTLRGDIDLFIRRQGAASFGSGRNIACIFQGIPSPRFPTETWKKIPEWSRYLCLPFEEIRTVANEELERAWTELAHEAKEEKAAKVTCKRNSQVK